MKKPPFASALEPKNHIKDNIMLFGLKTCELNELIQFNNKFA